MSEDDEQHLRRAWEAANLARTRADNRVDFAVPAAAMGLAATIGATIAWYGGRAGVLALCAAVTIDYVTLAWCVLSARHLERRRREALATLDTYRQKARMLADLRPIDVLRVIGRAKP